MSRPLRIFTDSFHCHSRAHCKSCRDPGERGQRWRDAMGKSYVMPEACPHGVEAGDVVVRVKPSAVPVPSGEWPMAARIVRRARKDGEAGVGTTLTRLIGHLGGDLYKRWFRKIAGKDCGCGDRAKMLDVMFPY